MNGNTREPMLAVGSEISCLDNISTFILIEIYQTQGSEVLQVENPKVHSTTCVL
jgi:hypothetical protein